MPPVFSLLPPSGGISAIARQHTSPFCTRFQSNLVPSHSRLSISSANALPLRSSSLVDVAPPLEAILFDIDGTLCDSDPLHFYAFQVMLQEVGFQGGKPIDREFYAKKVCGKHNDELCAILLPDWEFDRAIKFMDDKEAMFRRLAVGQLERLSGLDRLFKWVEDQGLKRAAVTNAPRASAEFLVSTLRLPDFFKVIVLAEECARPKPFPDPYLKALRTLQVSPKHAFVFEDSPAGIKAAKAAGMLVVGLATMNPKKLLLDAGAAFTVKDYNDPELWANLEELAERGKVAELAV